MVCAMNKKGKKDDKFLHNIVYTHAYSVIEVKTNICGKGINLALCRNPHGHRQADLKWNNNDVLWETHKDVKAVCKPSFKNDGSFWIQDDDFFGANSEHFNTLYLVKADINAKRPDRYAL